MSRTLYEIAYLLFSLLPGSFFLAGFAQRFLARGHELFTLEVGNMIALMLCLGLSVITFFFFQALDTLEDSYWMADGRQGSIFGLTASLFLLIMTVGQLALFLLLYDNSWISVWPMTPPVFTAWFLHALRLAFWPWGMGIYCIQLALIILLFLLYYRQSRGYDPAHWLRCWFRLMVAVVISLGFIAHCWWFADSYLSTVITPDILLSYYKVLLYT